MLLGAKIIAEDNTDKGRIDGVLECDNSIYIIELKIDTAEKALKQIKEKRYFEKYLNDGRKIILLGVGGFKDRNIRVLSDSPSELQ